MEPAKKRGRRSGPADGASHSSSSSSGGGGGGGAGARGSVRDRFVQLLKSSSDPVSEAALSAALGSLEKLIGVMQPLLKSGNLQISRQGNEQFYAWVDDQKAQNLKGLTPEQKHVYQIIAAHGNRGIHMRDLKFKASQSLLQLKTTLKKLKTKQLVKSINDIDNKTRQILILFELDPHPDCTGGAWYSNSEFDMDLIKNARTLVLRQLESAEKDGKRGMTVAQVAKALKDTGVFGVELGVKDIFQLLNTMELDLKVQRVRQSNGDNAEVQANDSLEAVGAVMFAKQGTPVRDAVIVSLWNEGGLLRSASRFFCHCSNHWLILPAR
eukprot:INCI16889.2.p1 GENE.INCI16889.2~~INCI16889.2.p1  ORF type:complete len:325 (-),score=71.86 INCI16889.2:225-1199(-)